MMFLAAKTRVFDVFAAKTRVLKVGNVSTSDICLSSEEIRTSVEVYHAAVVLRVRQLAPLHQGFEELRHLLSVLLVVHVGRADDVCFDGIWHFNHLAIGQNSVCWSALQSLVVRSGQNGPFSVLIRETVAQRTGSVCVSTACNTSGHVFLSFYFSSVVFFLLFFLYCNFWVKMSLKAGAGAYFSEKKEHLMGRLGGRTKKTPSNFGDTRQSYQKGAYVAYGNHQTY